jgi:hypothetical protein
MVQFGLNRSSALCAIPRYAKLRPLCVRQRATNAKSGNATEPAATLSATTSVSETTFFRPPMGSPEAISSVCSARRTSFSDAGFMTRRTANFFVGTAAPAERHIMTDTKVVYLAFCSEWRDPAGPQSVDS